MIVITGASGQLGRLVIEALLKKLPASEIVAAVRKPESVADLAARGVIVRQADYDRPETLSSAFAGADKLLLISANEVGRRLPQHAAVIDAARTAGVKLLAYTSLLHADQSPLGLAVEHKATEALIRESGLPFVLLRNGWYTENYLAGVPAALTHGAVIGCAGDGRISSAARQDYAEAAATVLSSEGHAGQVYELAGDDNYTLAEYAAALSRASGKAVAYHDLPQVEHANALIAAGLPAPFADLIADSDAGAAKGGLFDTSRTLSRLIGRPTTPLASLLDAALKAA